MLELGPPSSNCTLCDAHVDPPYPSPVHEFHVHLSVAPIATLSCAGVNLLFETVSEVVDEFTGGDPTGPGPVTPFDDPLPPQASIAVNRNTETVLVRLLNTDLFMDTSE
jgi:hypothetical protein